MRRFCAACALACARCVFGHQGSSLKFSKIALSPARGGPAAYKCSSRLRVVRLFFSDLLKKCSRLRVVPQIGRISLSLARGAFALSPARRGHFCALQRSRLRGVVFFATFSNLHSRLRAVPKFGTFEKLKNRMATVFLCTGRLGGNVLISLMHIVLS